MKALVLALAASPALAAGPASLEGARFAAEQQFARSFSMVREELPVGPLAPRIQEPLQPRAAMLRSNARELARVSLAAQLDRNLHLMTRVLGSRTWDIGSVGEMQSKNYYLTFQSGPTLTLAAVGGLDRIRHGFDVQLDASTRYNVRLQIGWPPMRNSTINLTPTGGTQGPSQRAKVGEILDAVKSHSVVFKAGGWEYWLQYGHDVKADGSGLAETKTILFIHQDGTDSKAWPLAESQLPIGGSVTVDLEQTYVTLTRTASGELIVSE